MAFITSFFLLILKKTNHMHLLYLNFSFVSELGLVDGQELAVADVTTPQTMLFKLHFTA